ncbi:MAG: hypothetical protein JXA96_13875 [Sedimentisphaerales bacterium]|nr:hypothetical protein [Sedimentisphaerales bacterium]
METSNRITLYKVILVVLVMLNIPFAIAQSSGRSGSRGGMSSGMRGEGGPGSRGGDMRGGGRSGPGRRGMTYQDEELSESQIDRVLKQLGTYNPNQVKQLEELRKTDKEQFLNELKIYAFPQILNITREDREYAGYLEWFEKYVPDEAAGIRDLKEENNNLYKKRIDTLLDKYRSLVFQPPSVSEEKMRLNVRDVQLSIKQRELSMQYWNPTITQEKKESLLSDIEEVVSEQYDQGIKHMKVDLEEIIKRIEVLQASVDQQIEEVKKWENPEFKKKETDNQIRIITEPTHRTFRRGPFGFNRSIPQMFQISDQDSNSAQ